MSKPYPLIIFVILAIVIIVSVAFSRRFQYNRENFLLFALVFLFTWTLIIYYFTYNNNHGLAWFFVFLPIWIIVLLWITTSIAHVTADDCDVGGVSCMI